MKKITSGVLIAAMAFSFAACGDDNGGGSAGGADAEDALKKAEEAMADVKSMSYDMIMDMEMSTQGQNVAMNTTAKADYIVDPFSMKMEMNIDMGDQGSAETTMYLVKEGEETNLYTGMDVTGSGTLAWTKEAVTDMSEYEQYNAKESFDLYLSSAKSFKEAGSEKVGDTDAVRYDGVIAEDSLAEVLENSGALSSFSNLGISEDAMASMLKDIGDLEISIWLAKDDYMPVKYEMDMTEMMQTLMNNIMKSAGQEGAVSIGKVFVSMTVSNINGVDSIEVPEEAKAA